MSYTTHVTIVDDEAGEAVHATMVETDTLPAVTIDGKKIDTAKRGNANLR